MMKDSELITIKAQAKIAWIDHNIRRLKNAIELEKYIMERIIREEDDRVRAEFML